MSGKVSAAGQEIPLNGEGVFDLKGKRGRLTLTTSVPGQGDVEIEEIIDGLVLYMRSDALAKGLPSGKKWLKIDLKAAGKPEPASIIAELQQLSGGSSDPTQFLTYLAKAGDVQKVGTEDVNGTSTTHYHATIDLDKLAGSAGSAADSVRQLEKLSGLKKLPTDIWIDGDQHVRRQTVAISDAAAGADQVQPDDRLQALRRPGRRARPRRRRDGRRRRHRGRLTPRARARRGAALTASPREEIRGDRDPSDHPHSSPINAYQI